VTAAYLDSSYLLAIIFGEPRFATLQRKLAGFDQIVSADLLTAECLSASGREGLDPASVLAPLRSIALVLPPRSLEAELLEASTHGRLRGADLWHVANALFVAGEARGDLPFLSRDEAQRKVARRLGFPTP